MWEVCDTRTDGRGARLYMTTEGRNPQNIADYGDADLSCTRLNDDIPDGTPVMYKLCLTEKNRDIGDCRETTDTA